MTCCEHSWAAISTHVWSWVPRSTHEYGAMVLMSTHSLIAPCSWLLFCSHGYSLLHETKFMAFHECCWWVIMSTHEHEHPLALMNSHALMSLVPWSNEHSWEHKCSHEHGYEHSSTLMSDHGTIPPYSWVFLGTHEQMWALTGVMGAHEHSEQVMSAEPFHQTINK